MGEAREALKVLQLEMNVPKSQWNKFGEFFYRNVEDIYQEAKRVIAEKDLPVTLTLEDDVSLVGERFYIVATALLQSVGGDDAVSVKAWAREEEKRPKMADPMCTGSASSYARKYALNGLFLLDDQRDPDTLDNTQQGKKKKTPPTTTPPPNNGVGEMPDFEPTEADQDLNRLLKALKASASKCETEKGLDQFWEDNASQIDMLSLGMGKNLEKHVGEIRKRIRGE